MKRILIVLLVGITIVLSACTNGSSQLEEGEVRLPDLENKVESEIIEILDNLQLETNILERTYVEQALSNQFIEYGSGYEPGDVVMEGDFITVIVSAAIVSEDVYFTPVDLEYDGPLLDDSYFDMALYTENTNKIDDDDPDYFGAGGAFLVGSEAISCTDGDTSVFDYPSDINNKITSYAKSTRFLNMDTPETFDGGEEEWGKPASVYVCDLLDQAQSIVLQTDPGDYLVGNYGRLLAWVWIQLPEEEEYFLLNYMVVRQGLAEVKYLYGAGETDVTVYNDMTYTEWMLQAESNAQSDQLGMYGDLLDYYWDYDNDRPYPGRWN
jgi:endonuclease YncB( thermonuclease family)